VKHNAPQNWPWDEKETRIVTIKRTTSKRSGVGARCACAAIQWRKKGETGGKKTRNFDRKPNRVHLKKPSLKKKQEKIDGNDVRLR